MSAELVGLRRKGLLGYTDLSEIFVDVSGEKTYKAMLERQGIDAIGQAYALGITRQAICDHFGCDLRTLWDFEQSLSDDDKKFLKATPMIMAEDLERECLVIASKKMELELDYAGMQESDMSPEQIEELVKAKMDNLMLIKGSADYIKIVMTATAKIIDRHMNKGEDNKGGIVNNTQIIINENASWVTGASKLINQ